MTTATLPDTRPNTTSDPDADHVVCCNENVAMCGEDVSGDEWSNRGPEYECPMCLHLEEHGLPCPVAGCRAGRAMWWQHIFGGRT